MLIEATNFKTSGKVFEVRSLNFMLMVFHKDLDLTSIAKLTTTVIHSKVELK